MNERLVVRRMPRKANSRRIFSPVLLATLSLLTLAGPLAGQIPGQRIPSRERMRAEYIRNIMDGVDQTRVEWMADIEGDRLDPLMATYTSDAMIVPPGGEPLYGRDAIRQYWEEHLPEIRTVQTGMGDMDASGQMAMVGGTYSMEVQQENGAIVRESGGLLTVYVQISRRWFVRAQVFGVNGEG